MRRLAAALLVVVSAACGGRPTSAELPPATSPSLPAPVPLPPAAQRVASSYAAVACSYRFDTGPSAWIDAVADLCTPRWVQVLRTGSSAGGSRGLGPGRAPLRCRRRPARRGGVRIEVRSATGGVVDRRSAVVEFDLVRSGGRWLVGGAR